MIGEQVVGGSTHDCFGHFGLFCALGLGCVFKKLVCCCLVEWQTKFDDNFHQDRSLYILGTRGWKSSSKRKWCLSTGAFVSYLALVGLPMWAAA